MEIKLRQGGKSVRKIGVGICNATWGGAIGTENQVWLIAEVQAG
jgi:hypothetical protein